MEKMTNQRNMLLADIGEITNVIDNAIEKAIAKFMLGKVPQAEENLLGDLIPLEKAMELLNRKKTWFHNKRESDELPGIKSANQWWYKKEDIKHFIENGQNSGMDKT